MSKNKKSKILGIREIDEYSSISFYEVEIELTLVRYTFYKDYNHELVDKTSNIVVKLPFFLHVDNILAPLNTRVLISEAYSYPYKLGAHAYKMCAHLIKENSLKEMDSEIVAKSFLTDYFGNNETRNHVYLKDCTLKQHQKKSVFCPNTLHLMI